MSPWQITNDRMNEFAILGIPDDIESDAALEEGYWEQFKSQDGPLLWAHPPRLMVVVVEEGEQKPKPRADVSYFNLEGLVLNDRARDALGDVLTPFGQLLDVDVDGHTEYYYHVTHRIACIDHSRSERGTFGQIRRALFNETSIPLEPSVFKDPTQPDVIFVNDAAKALLEQRIVQHGITGIGFTRRKG